MLDPTTDPSPEQKLKLPQKPIEGKAIAYFETGLEGMVWSVYNAAEQEKGTLGSLHYGIWLLKKGDLVLITSPSGETLFSGEIDPDDTINRESLPIGGGQSQCVSMGRWVHWVQRGWDADEWGGLFMLTSGESSENSVVLIPTEGEPSVSGL